jgi:peptidoglycan hydrolase CwlO-like protein
MPRRFFSKTGDIYADTGGHHTDRLDAGLAKLIADYNSLTKELRELEKEHKALQLKVASEYVTRDNVEARRNQLDQELRLLENKIDHKFDQLTTYLTEQWKELTRHIDRKIKDHENESS